MIDTKLEDRLATMFDGRAATISTVRPIRFDPSGKGRTRLSPAPFAVAAAVAAVLVTVGGTVVGIRAAHHRTGPLGATSSTNVASPTATPTAAGACTRTMPRSWQQAILAGQIPLDHAINNVLSVNADTGDYLVDQVRPAVGSSGQVTLAVFHGKTGQDVAQLPGNGSTEALANGSAAITPGWIAYGLHHPGAQNGYSTAMLYNRHTGQSTVLSDPASATGQLNGAPILFGGKVYWLEAGYGGKRPSLVNSYDLATGVRAATAVPAAVDLIYYGTGLAVVTQDNLGNSALANYTGETLAATAIRAAVGASYFSYDGSTLRWWNYSSNPFSPVLYANRPGSAEVGRTTVKGQNVTGVSTWPLVEVGMFDPSSPIFDLRTNTLLVIPDGLNVQAVFGDQALIGTGLTKLGNGGLSLVPLKDLPPAHC